MKKYTEEEACHPVPVADGDFNTRSVLPYGLTVDHVHSAMSEYLDFLGFVNQSLHTREIPRLESFLMAANFSSMVGEFMTANIPKYCKGLAKNKYHNGHPDMVPRGVFDGDSVQYAEEGIEVKASRYDKGWQGHNPEDCFLMVFVFENNGPNDAHKGKGPLPFRFKMEVGAKLEKDDWRFSGRSSTSRRTITASVTKSGYDKMVENWIYAAPDVRKKLGL